MHDPDGDNFQLVSAALWIDTGLCPRPGVMSDAIERAVARRLALQIQAEVRGAGTEPRGAPAPRKERAMAEFVRRALRAACAGCARLLARPLFPATVETASGEATDPEAWQPRATR